jgi:acetyl esterase/lipase
MQNNFRRSTNRLLFLFALACPLLAQQTSVPLWIGTAPGSEGKTAPESVRITPEGDHVYSSVHHPSITVYLPQKGAATGAGVLVIPGGGHSEIWIDHEGFNVAAWLSQHGIAAFVLKYRLAREPGSTYTVEGTELSDARRAMRLIRSHATEWNVDPSRLGVIGFSAGGELAALLSARSVSPIDKSTTTPDNIDRLSSKPAFQGLIYPALPKDLPLSKETPPAFLACGANDRTDISEGLPALYLSMKRAGTPVELHIFSGVGHGFGIRATNPANAADWPDLFYRWLESSNFIRPINQREPQ